MKKYLTGALAGLVVVAGLAAACAGGGSEGSDAAAADATPSASLQITAKDIKFDKRTLVANANADVSLTLVNADGGTLHNFAVYKDKKAREKIYVGELVTGPKTQENRFRAPGPGTYYFRCDTHPDVMTGQFITK